MYIRPYRGKHRCEVEVNGQRASKLLDTKREARDWGLRKEKELEGRSAASAMTAGQGAAKYLSTVSTGKAEGAVQWETRRFAEFLAFVGADTPLVEIDGARIGQWRDFRLKTVSGSTVLRHSTPIRHMFELACTEWGVLTRNPFAGVRMPDHNPARHQVWTWRQIRVVLRSQVGRSDNYVQAIRAFHIALHTAMRLNEILVAEVHGKVAILPRDKSSKKLSAPVKVPLARHGARLFAKYGPFTISADIASAMFSELCSQLMIEDVTFHDSRATALTLLSRRMDVMTLARISRHKDLRILMNTYYRESAEEIAARI